MERLALFFYGIMFFAIMGYGVAMLMLSFMDYQDKDD